DADFVLYDDDGKTYAYEKGDSKITRLHWDDAAQKLTHQGAQAWTEPDEDIIEIAKQHRLKVTVVRPQKKIKQDYHRRAF
ncbi:MAG TPA: DUF5110 domain-containing protein, partial [Terriglobales bacterium]|nr:DUF5110 domain-containing protein [Terriglobales bacterium]